jgi:hypothetical protein
VLEALGERVARLPEHVERHRLQLVAQEFVLALTGSPAAMLQRKRAGHADQDPDYQQQSAHTDEHDDAVVGRHRRW